MNKKVQAIFTALLLLVLALPATAHADAKPGDVIVTLGKDLTIEQKENVLNQMKVNENEVEIVYVTNEEEHKYLGDYISDEKIGTHAISSAKITLAEEGAGLNVKTNNITYVTEAMYANALMTAGIHDADIFVTAPFKVSGTAGLTGILKAYDVKTDLKLTEDQKKVANEELVKTAELGEDIGKDKAAQLITKIKQALADHPVESKEDLRELIDKAAKDLNVQLTDEQMNQLLTLFDHIKNLDIDWSQLKNELNDMSEQLNQFLSDEDTQSFFKKVLQAIGSLIDQIRSWF
ncbi:MAG TPA: DUF1002 domain-containing protein [Bacillales bacterium]|nr:DUF1002 domain-containing protein [Bacillales bacterium]